MSPGLHEVAGQLPALGDHADTCGGDVHAVGRALADDLRIAGDDLHARLRRGFAHVGDDFAEFGDRETLLDDERRRQPLRTGARHREVVDRSVHGDVADGSARKAPRRNDIRVGREREPFTGGGTQRGGVAELFEFVVAERLEEHRVDQRGRRLAACPVRERHHVVEQPRPALPELVDPFQHTVFAFRRVLMRVRSVTGTGHVFLGHRPQAVSEHCVALLYAVDALRVHREAEVEVVGGGHPAAVVTGEPDGEQSPLLGFGDRRHQVFGIARRGQRDRDVAIACVSDDLALEDQFESDVVAQCRHHRFVGGQGPGGHRPPRAGRLNSDASVAASVELPPLPSV